MPTSPADTAIDAYLEIEERLLEFMKAVPYHSGHLKTYSVRLASLLVDTCSFIEAILKFSMDNTRYNTIGNIATLRNKRNSTNPPYLNINDLRTVFKADQFYAKRVFHLPTSQGSFPWYLWRKNTISHPEWWGSYNKVKHDLFNNISQAKYGSVAHAAQGAFLCLAQSLDLRQRLVERGLIRCSRIPVSALLTTVSSWEPLNSKESIVAVTNAFGYKFTSTGSPKQANDISPFIYP